MNESTLNRMVADATEIGRRNQQIISLARGWCSHVRVDRGMFGVGEVERVTGLPVSGGTFTCDYARGHSPAAMQLENIALDFYERNCKACPHRASPGVLPNLGTWAESQLRERADREAVIEREHQEEQRQRAERRQHRRLLAGQLTASAESILDLMDRIDSTEYDKKAHEDLTSLADLHPDAFGDDLLEMLLLEAEANKVEVFLDAVVRVHSSIASPNAERLVPVAVRAMAGGWGARAAAPIVSRYAVADDVVTYQGLVRHAIVLAAEPRDSWFASPRPRISGPLVRLVDVAEKDVEAAYAAELRRGEEWRRAAAASALEVLVEQTPDLAMRLLPALLDGLKIGDDDPFDSQSSPREALALSLGMLILRDPTHVDEVVSTRLKQASDEYREALLRGYDNAARSNLNNEIPEAAATVIARRSLDVVLGSRDGDVRRSAANTYELVCTYHRVDIALGGSSETRHR